MKTFIKAIIEQASSDLGEIKKFERWNEEHNIRFKLNLLYAVILGAGIISFIFCFYFSNIRFR